VRHTTPGASTGKDPAVEPILPAHRHTWAELLRLVDTIRRLAYDRTMEPDDQMRQIRDAFLDYDEGSGTTSA